MEAIAIVQKKTKPAAPMKRPHISRGPARQHENVMSILRDNTAQPAFSAGQWENTGQNSDSFAESLVSASLQPLLSRKQRIHPWSHTSPLIQRACASRDEEIRLKADDETDYSEAFQTATPGFLPALDANHTNHIWSIRNDRAGSMIVQRVPEMSMASEALSDEFELDGQDIQTKLRIGSPGDALEQEADATADSVMQTWTAGYTLPGDMSTSSGIIFGAPTAMIQRAGDGDVDDATLDAQEETEEQNLQCAAKDATADGEPEDSAAIADALRQNGGRGQPLVPTTRTFMESRLGFDFSSVRIHRDAAAARLTDRLSAYAFATGRDIYFAPGMYRPGSCEGDRLLAHELTHVVQQAGGAQNTAPVVQRSVERKDYYNGVPGLTGSSVHELVERRLHNDNRNKKLLTEAPIAHATRNRVEFNVVGFADLYRATDNKVAKFRGDSETLITPPPSTGGSASPGPQVPSPPPAQREYKELSNTIQNRVGGNVLWRPELETRSDGSLGMRYFFPREFYVADLKPWSPSRMGGGIVQIRNYIEGLTKFAAKAKMDLNGSGPTPNGQAMRPGMIHIPAELDFRNFDINNNALGQGLQNGQRNERIWLIQPGPGLVLYVPIAMGTAGPGTSLQRDLARYQREIARLRGQLRGTIPSINAPVDISRKLKPTQPKPLKHTRSSARERVQRTPKHRHGRVNWVERGRRWQRQRKQLRRGIRRFLRGRGEILQVVAAVANKAGSGLNRNTHVAMLGRNVETIDFWSGPWGGFIGGLRFRLGSAWDFFAQKLDSMRRRFRRWSRRAKAIGRSGVGFGWRRKLIHAILRAGSLAITQFLSDTFRVFGNCATALMEKALQQILDEASPETRERFCELQRGFEAVSTELDRLFQEHFAGYEEAIESLREVGSWTNLISSLITLIRVGVQVVSCLSPPALGCLWGLVAQVGIEVAVNLVVGTEWFQREVIGSSQVRNFFRRFFRSSQQGLLNAAINAAGLQKLSSGVTQCDVSEPSRDPLRGGAPGGLRGSALLRHRRQWERANRAAINQAIREHYVNAQGQPATRRDARRTLNILKFANLPPEQLKRLLEQHRTPDGKISMPDAERAVIGAGIERIVGLPSQTGTTPSEPAEEPAAERPPAGASPREEEAEIPAQPGGATPTETPQVPSGETPKGEPGREPAEEGGVPVRTHPFRAPPSSRASQAPTGSVHVNIVAGMSRDRQVNPDRTFPVTLEFFAEGEVHRITGAPVALVGTRTHSDGRMIYDMQLTQKIWVEAIDLTLFPGRFIFVFARGL